MILWGSYVPFVHLIPFIVVILLTLEQKNTKVFIGYVLFLLLLETFCLLPFIRTNGDIGSVNSLIVFSLTAMVLPLFSIAFEFFDHLSVLNSNIKMPNSAIPFTQFLIKGIYASLILHFSNNIVNNIIWGEKTPIKEKQQLLELFANTSQNTLDTIEVTTLVTVLCEYHAVNKNDYTTDLRISLSDAQIILITLFDLIGNYKKHDNYSTVAISVTNQKSQLHFAILGKKITNTPVQIKKNRYIGYLEYFLKLANKGSIAFIDSDNTFETQYRIITDVV
jgi:hypothetical protein